MAATAAIPLRLSSRSAFCRSNSVATGAPWINPVQPTGVTDGRAADGAQLAADVQKARDYMARTGRPLFLG